MPRLNLDDLHDAMLDAFTYWQLEIIDAALRTYTPVTTHEQEECKDLRAKIDTVMYRHRLNQYADDIPE